MPECEQIIQVNITPSEGSIQTEDIPGLDEAIGNVRDLHQPEFVHCEERPTDFFVRWNETTETVRIDLVAPAATYEVPDNGGD